MEEEPNNTSVSVDAKKKISPLVVVLVFLLILIVGLVIGILVFKLSGKEQQQIVGSSGTKCDKIADEYEKRVCLGEGDYEQNKGESYYNAIEQAFNDKNYGLFESLVEDSASGLVLPGWCEDAFSFLDTIEQKYANELPILNQYGLYVIGSQSALECEDSKKEGYYVGKIYAILADDRYYEAILEEEDPQRNTVPEEVNSGGIQEEGEDEE